jgi:hypothetical protein
MTAMFFLAPCREDYGRFLAIMVDRDELPQTFEEWEREIVPKVADLKARGVVLNPVTFDAEEFVAFCLAENLPCGDKARAHFAAEAARRIVERKERERDGARPRRR